MDVEISKFSPSTEMDMARTIRKNRRTGKSERDNYCKRSHGGRCKCGWCDENRFGIKKRRNAQEAQLDEREFPKFEVSSSNLLLSAT